MKNFLRTMFPAVLLLTFLSGSALAQTKVATVDMRQLFDNYWKTKQVQATIQDSAAQLDKDDKGMKDDLKKASERPGHFRRRTRPPQTGRCGQGETIGGSPHGH
jgi:Skp family chaperone for outer membrane proteins